MTIHIFNSIGFSICTQYIEHQCYFDRDAVHLRVDIEQWELIRFYELTYIAAKIYRERRSFSGIGGIRLSLS